MKSKIWASVLNGADEFRNKRKYLFRYLFAALIWDPICTLVYTSIFHEPGLTRLAHWTELTLTLILTSTVCYASISLVTKLEERYYRSKNKPVAPQSPLFYFWVFLGPAPIATNLALRLLSKIYRALGLRWVEPDLSSWLNIFFLAAMMTTISFVIKKLIDTREEAEAAELRAKKLENDRLQAQLTALAAQINPHFLFNALNTVAAQIPSDPIQAEETLVQLSQLYRGVLAAIKRSTHPLSTELELCRAILDIEQARFGERLKVHFEIEPGVDPARLEIPVLTVQPLIENAVKHGLSSRASGGSIWIKVARRSDTVEVRVEDDGIGMGASRASGTGTGLANCRDRMQLTYGDAGKAEIQARPGGGTTIILNFPVSIDLKNLSAARAH